MSHRDFTRFGLNVTSDEFGFMSEEAARQEPGWERRIVMHLGLPTWCLDGFRTFEVLVHRSLPAIPWRGAREHTVERLEPRR